MITWKDIPDMYKAGVALVGLTVFMLSYHNQFITEAEAAEQQGQVVQQLIAIRVEGKEEKKERKIEEKAKAVAEQNVVEAEKLQQEIETLQHQINSLCNQIDDC